MKDEKTKKRRMSKNKVSETTTPLKVELFDRERIACSIYLWMEEGFPDPSSYFTDSPTRFVAQLIIDARKIK
jgi:hypothetical protein